MSLYLANAVEMITDATLFGAICPGTGRIVGIEDAQAAGEASARGQGLLARCPHCGTEHEWPGSALFRLGQRQGARSWL